MIPTKNYLVKLRTDELLNLSKFVVKENFIHHSNKVLPIDYENDIKSILEEEMNYKKNAEIFVYKDCLGNILGSIRALRWNCIDVLPIQKLFNIDPLLVIGDTSINSIWHIGRFAIKKEVSDINLFKKLMICAITPVCKHKDTIVFAECDSKLRRIITLLGIESTVIGDSINYLGSETIPISMTYDGLIGFYNKNKNLVSKDVFIPKVNMKKKNYSFV